jgi:predicted metal-dependent hydrolase
MDLMEETLRRGILLFNQGEFFASHEVLEEAWKLERGPRRQFLQAVIHVAVGLHHVRQGNPAGASGQFLKALDKLAPYLPAYEGVDTHRLYADVAALAQLTATGALAGLEPQIRCTEL